MASLSDIVAVNVTTSGVALKQAGFGVPMIVGAHSRFAERVRFYAEPADMLADGFTATDPEYLAASAIVAQNPRVTLFAVGRRASKPTMQITVTPSVVNSKAYKIKIGGVEKAFTSDANATLSEIVQGLVTAIGAVAGFTVAAVGGVGAETAFTITGAAAGSWLRVETLDPSLLSVAQTHADPGLAADLDAIALENGDWYGVVLTTASKAEVLALAAWIETNKRLGVQSSQDTEILTNPATDVASALKAGNYFRTALIYHPDNGAFAGAAWLGATLPATPGSITFKFKTLKGVASVPLTGTHIANLKAKNCNFYTAFGSVSITAEGKTAGGEWIDVIRDRDWFEARLRERVFTVLTTQGKVPYTDGGIASIEAETRSQLTEGISSGFLSDNPAPVVIVPTAASVSATDKGNRKLPNVTFKATVAGAIHVIEIAGNVSV